MERKIKTIHINTILHKELRVFVAQVDEGIQEFVEAAIRNEIDRRKNEMEFRERLTGKIE